MEPIIRQVFTSATQEAGTTVDFHELVPTGRETPWAPARSTC